MSANGTVLFLFMWSNIPLYVLSIPLLGYLGHFNVLAIVNTAATNIWVHGSFGIIIFSGCMIRSEIAKSSGSSNFTF